MRKISFSEIIVHYQRSAGKDKLFTKDLHTDTAQEGLYFSLAGEAAEKELPFYGQSNSLIIIAFDNIVKTILTGT